jgi:hypothetical protein
MRVRYHVASSVEDDTRAESYRCADLYDRRRDCSDETGERVGINPESVVMLRVVDS